MVPKQGIRYVIFNIFMLLWLIYCALLGPLWWPHKMGRRCPSIRMSGAISFLFNSLPYYLADYFDTSHDDTRQCYAKSFSLVFWFPSMRRRNEFSFCFFGFWIMRRRNESKFRIKNLNLTPHYWADCFETLQVNTRHLTAKSLFSIFWLPVMWLRNEVKAQNTGVFWETTHWVVPRQIKTRLSRCPPISFKFSVKVGNRAASTQRELQSNGQVIWKVRVHKIWAGTADGYIFHIFRWPLNLVPLEIAFDSL